MSGIHSQTFFDHVKESATNTHKTILKRVLHETAESTAVKIEHDKKISKEKYISSEERHKLISD